MFDITTVREISYGQNQEHHVYVYRDHDQPNLWYMVPTPTLRRVGQAPAFSLVEYTANGAGISGLCSFEVELIQPPEARAAAEKVLGPGTEWGGFTWVGGTAFFHYDIEGEARMVAVEPTLYGTNVASFQVELANQAALNTFINAFSTGGGASPFRIEYDMQALTKLLGAKATVKYDAQAAIRFENSYRTERDTWGNQRTILVETKLVLQQSGAGDVKVEIGAGGTPELEQRVRDWAWTTLEQQVAATANAAAVMATGPSPVSATTSFEQSYSEDTVVDWATPVSTFLPKFTEAEWSSLFTKVDNRRLVVNFALIGQLTRTDNGLPIAQKVMVTVDYPTRQTGNTFDLVVADGSRSSLTYEADGDFSGGAYNPRYKYRYDILFAEGGGYASDWITSTQTQTSITPSDFGARQVAFIGRDIPFVDGSVGKNVKEVMIDFFFAPPEGKAALVQTSIMAANGELGVVNFTSYYNLPIGPSYHYKLRYRMADNSIITSGSPIAFANAPNNTISGNATIIYVLDPKSLYTQFDLRTFNVPGSQPIAMVDLTAQYFDTQNDGDEALYHNTWNAWTPRGTPLIETAQPSWNFQAVDNTNTAFFNMQGQIYYPDGRSVNLSQYKQPSGVKAFMIYSDSENYSITVNTFAIDWDEVAAVNLTLFRLTPEAQAKYGDHPPTFFLKPRGLMTTEERLIADRAQVDVYDFSLLSAPAGQPVDNYSRHYALRRPKSQPMIEFYYTAQYILRKDGATRILPRQEVSGVLSINLPPLPPAGGEFGLVRHRIDPEELRAAQSAQVQSAQV